MLAISLLLLQNFSQEIKYLYFPLPVSCISFTFLYNAITKIAFDRPHFVSYYPHTFLFVWEQTSKLCIFRSLSSVWENFKESLSMVFLHLIVWITQSKTARAIIIIFFWPRQGLELTHLPMPLTTADLQPGSHGQMLAIRKLCTFSQVGF